MNNMSQAIKERAKQVLKELEAIPQNQRSQMHPYAVDAAKEAIRLASRNPIAAAVQLEDAQCELTLS